jgi:hypothetical protein
LPLTETTERNPNWVSRFLSYQEGKFETSSRFQPCAWQLRIAFRDELFSLTAAQLTCYAYGMDISQDTPRSPSAFVATRASSDKVKKRK